MKRLRPGGAYVTADELLRRIPRWHWSVLHWWVQGMVWWLTRVRPGAYRCRVCGCTDAMPCQDECHWLYRGMCQKCDEAAAYWTA